MPSTTNSQTPSTFVSSSTPTQYDVFLSFRCKDTRLTFTGHLYDKLVCSGIQTFMDDPELRSGEVISDALLDAIRKSKSYIVVLLDRFVGETEKVNNWRFTLTEVAGFSGYHISQNRSEADVINGIVDELLLK